ncbi:putative histidine kinase [Calothrix sp. NIES-4071]|nr:putative histidine kinase [Calothrix sp. NIES-4071]BAZ60329.1 putative histidine kinase [Calothrix sp. NIES-4105]
MINPESNQYQAHLNNQLNNQQEERLALLLQILNSISDPIFVKNSQHEWIFLNDAFCNFIGYRREELIGKTDYDFFPKEEADIFWKKDEQVFLTNQFCENEEFFTDSFGVTHIISTKKTLFFDKIGNKFLVGTIRDITSIIEKYLNTEEALQNAYTKMETLVFERTQQLLQINLALQAEIADHQKTEQGLRESKAQLNKLAANVPGVLYQFMLQPDGSMSFPYISSGSQDIFELAPKQIQASPNSVFSLIHPDDRNAFSRDLLKSINTLHSWQWEGKIILKSGTKWIKAISRPERLVDGAILWHGVASDVTERKQIEIALRASQQRLSLLIEQTPLAIIEWNPKLEVESWNPAAEKIFGYTKDKIIGCNIGVLVPEHVKEHVEKVVGDLLTSRAGNCSVNENLTADGRIIICEWHNNPLVTRTGEIIGVASIAIDITERKQLEAERQIALIKLEAALDKLQRTQLQLVQNEKMSSLGQMVAGIAHEINNPVSFIYGNLTYTSEYSQNLLNLLKLYQEKYPQPVKEIQDCIQDIDLEFLQKDVPLLLNSMKMGAERIRQIVVSLRNFSRLDEAEMKTVNIHEGIDSTLMILNSRLNQQNRRPKINVIKNYDVDLPLVHCYAGQLNQVFMNILVNAIDALEQLCFQNKVANQELTINIQTQNIQASSNTQNRILISIADNGCGIPQDVQQKIFDPFFTTKPVGQGTGLGLSIAYQIIVDKHHGELRCISNPAQGTEFKIEIPLRC